MKKLLTTLVALSAATFAYGQTEIVAAWDFASFAGFNFPQNDFDGDFVGDDVFASDYVAGGTLSGFGATDLTGGQSGVIGLGSLNSNGADAITGGFINNDIFAGFIAPADNGITLTLAADFSQYENLVLTMGVIADQGSATLDFSTGDSFGITTVDSLVTVDLSSLDGQANGSLGLTFSDLSGFGNNVRFDNIQVVGTVVPEPSTYAAIAGALALGFVAYRRRK